MGRKRKQKHMEENLELRLREGKLDAKSPQEQAIDELTPLYEYREETTSDPIKQETEKIQQVVKEENERYLNLVQNEDRHVDEKHTASDTEKKHPKP